MKQNRKFDNWAGWDAATRVLFLLFMVGGITLGSMTAGKLAPVSAQTVCSTGGVFSCGGVTGLTSDGVAITASLPVRFPNGTAAAPSIAWAADADGTGTGFFRPAANAIGVSSNGTERWRFDTTANALEATSVMAVNSYGFASTLTGTAILTMAPGGTGGALRILSGTAPTCTSNCGTSPSIAGNNSNMTVTLGTSVPVATTFTVTFNGTWTNAPNCVGGRGTTGLTPTVAGIVTTTTTAVVNLGANSVDSETYKIICFGP